MATNNGSRLHNSTYLNSTHHHVDSLIKAVQTVAFLTNENANILNEEPKADGQRVLLLCEQSSFDIVPRRRFLPSSMANMLVPRR
jgi:hypothetical protein